MVVDIGKFLLRSFYIDSEERTHIVCRGSDGTLHISRYELKAYLHLKIRENTEYYNRIFLVYRR